MIEGRPFVGKSGQELWAGMDRFCRLHRDQFWVTNIVKDSLPNNRDPKPDEIARAIPEFLDELEMVQPRIVVTAGAFSTRVMLGDVKMADVHGIPHTAEVAGHQYLCLPMYHPAAGLHSKGVLAAFAWDLQQLRKLLDGTLAPWTAAQAPTRTAGNPDDLYTPRNLPRTDRERHSTHGPDVDLRRHVRIGHPTARNAAGNGAGELQRGRRPGGSGGLESQAQQEPVHLRRRAGRKGHRSALDYHDPAVVSLDTEGWADQPWGLSACLNGQHGIIVQADDHAGLKYFSRWIADKTLVLHNALHDIPVLRAMGIELGAYHDTQVLAYHDMLRTGSGVLEAESQNLGTLAYRECGMKLRELSDCAGVDFSTRTIPYTNEVMQYAGMDAVATWRLYQVYAARGLTTYEPYVIDMGQVPLVEQMIRTGLPIDADAALEYYMEVLDKLEAVTEDLRHQAAKLGNRDFNPGSHPQVRELLTRRLSLRIRKRTRGGKASTNEKALADHRDHPFVAQIQARRELDKLRSTYLAPLLEAIS